MILFCSRKPFVGVGVSYLNTIFSYYFSYGFIEHNNMFLFKGNEGMSHFNRSNLSMWGIPTVSRCMVATGWLWVLRGRAGWAG